MKALGHGAELLSDAAENFERAADIWATESQMNLIERAIEREISGEFCRYGIEEKLDEHEELFQKFAERADANDVVRVRARREQLIARVNEATAKVSIAEIKEAEAALQQRTFSRPVDHKRRLEILSAKIDSALEILPANRQQLIQEFQERRKQLSADAQCLETQRDTEEFGYYPDGSKKSVLRRRDSKLNGDSEEWYENGMRKQLAQFSNGKCDGQFFCWRDDGSLIVQAIKNRSTGERIQTIYLENGTIVCVVRFESSKNGQMKIWLWNGVYLGKACINHGSVERGGFLFQMLFRPLVWMSVFKAWKYKADRDGLENLVEATRHWEASINVIDRMQDIDKNPKIF